MDITIQEPDINENMTFVDWSEFIANIPPSSVRKIRSAVKIIHGKYQIQFPQISLYCPNEACERTMFFTYQGGSFHTASEEWDLAELPYQCNNCKVFTKLYVVLLKLTEPLQQHSDNSLSATAIKIGEWPKFGPDLPAKLISIIRADRKLFVKGRNAEAQGMGIGAYSYYRRVVENQRNRLIDETIKAAKKLEASSNIISKLEAAKKEKRFTESIHQIKDVIPDSLYIKGQNPFILLYDALSTGIHGKTDNECLDLARSIRTVLTQFSVNLTNVTKDTKEIDNAIKTILDNSTQKD